MPPAIRCSWYGCDHAPDNGARPITVADPANKPAGGTTKAPGADVDALVDANDPEFAAALQTVLRDLQAQSAVQPELRIEPAYGPMLYAPDGSGQGLTHPRGTTTPDRLANLADQVQEWAVEALWTAGVPAVWPHCPEHPNSHPLRATVADETAVWTCPKSGTVVARIGELERRSFK